MPDDLDKLIRRTRRVVRARSADADEQAAIPPGFADRVARARKASSTPVPLFLWQRLSYAGVAVACAVAMASAVLFRGEAEMQLAADPWLDMPMSSFGDESEGGGWIGQ